MEDPSGGAQRSRQEALTTVSLVDRSAPAGAWRVRVLLAARAWLGEHLPPLAASTFVLAAACSRILLTREASFVNWLDNLDQQYPWYVEVAALIKQGDSPSGIRSSTAAMCWSAIRRRGSSI